MKLTYSRPELEITVFDVKDILMASGELDNEVAVDGKDLYN